MRASITALILLSLLVLHRGANSEDTVPGAIDVSGDDCIASALVFDQPPVAKRSPPGGVPFINDVCNGDQIVLGIRGQRLALKRQRDSPLGSGGAYTNQEFTVLVSRGKFAYRKVVARPPYVACHAPHHSEYVVAHQALVKIWSSNQSWTVNGTLWEGDCAP
jgi:hypothetical protein